MIESVVSATQVKFNLGSKAAKAYQYLPLIGILEDDADEPAAPFGDSISISTSISLSPPPEVLKFQRSLELLFSLN